MTLVRMSREQARKVRLTSAQKKRLEALTDAEITAAAKADPDNPPLTKAEFASIAKMRRGGRPPLPDGERKVQVTLRLSRGVIEHFRAGGPGWQTRMGETLRRASSRAPAGSAAAKRRKAK